MYKDKRIMAIIPARGGSKGLKNKNILPLLNKPLIGWTIEQSKESIYLDEIFVSTDSEEIADVAKLFGINVKTLRPDYLSKDDSSTIDVVLHVISQYEQKRISFDYILLLEPTSPLRKVGDIDNSIKLAIDCENSDGVISVGEVHLEHPWIVKRINELGYLTPYIENARKVVQRQQTDVAYFPYGVVYLVKTDVLKKFKSFYTDNILPYLIERWQNYEIDDIYDFVNIEAILNFKKI